MVYDNSHVGADDEYLPQEPQEIGLVETLHDDAVCDMFVCALGKFHRDLYLATPSEAGIQSMLGSLEPMCMGEEVDERIMTIEERTERVTIYEQHRDSQAALASATAAAIAAAPSAAAAGAVAGAVVVATPFDVVAHFLAD